MDARREMRDDVDDHDDDTAQTFGEVLNHLKNQQSSQRGDDGDNLRLAAVTSAIVETIASESSTSNGHRIEPSPDAVYAKVISALQSSLRQDEVDVGTQLALMQLFMITVPRLKPAMLTATISMSSLCLRSVVAQGGGDDSVKLVRMATRVTAAVLCRLGGGTAEKEILHLFQNTLMSLSTHTHFKLQQEAESGIVHVLSSHDVSGTARKVVMKSVTSYMHEELVNAAQTHHRISYERVLNLLPLMSRAILLLNYKKLGSDAMEFLSVLLEHNIATAATSSDFMSVPKVQENTPRIQTVAALLSTVSTMLQSESAHHQAYLNEFAPRVWASLLQAKPTLVFRAGVAEYEVLQNAQIAYGQLILTCANRMFDANAQLTLQLLPLSVQIIFAMSKPSCDDPLDSSVAQTLMVELTQLYRSKLPTIVSNSNHDSVQLKCWNDLIQSTRHLVTTDAAMELTWSVSLIPLVVLIQYVHDKAPELTADTVTTLLNLRTHASQPRQGDVENATSTLIQGVGIEIFWDWVVWHPTNRIGIASDRIWVLSTMRSAASVAQSVYPRLSFFQTSVLGLARSCDKLAATTSGSDQNMHQSSVVLLWSLFPCFCKAPTDIADCLTPLTATLCKAMEDNRYPDILTSICNGLITLIKSMEDSGSLELESASADVTTVGDSCTKLMPVLFKVVSNTHAMVSTKNSTKHETMEVEGVDDKSEKRSAEDFQRLQCVTDAISSLAQLAPDNFLRLLFKKLMKGLLEEVQTERSDNERICALLTLSQALINSRVLDEASISFLYRALKPLVRNDEHGPRVQKRAYKVLAELCERHHSFIADPERLKEISALLTGTILTSQIAARYMRLKCLNIIVGGLETSDTEQIKEVHKVMAEVLLCLKDSNGKTRDSAYQLLQALATRGDIVDLLKVVMAALAAQTPHMRSAVVMALSRIVFENGAENEKLFNMLPSLLQTVLVLIDEGSREVVKSVVGFVRICVAVVPPECLHPLLPEIVEALLRSDQVKNRFRSKIKIILKKLVRMFGYDMLLPFVPAAEVRLLTHMRKLEQRDRRKREARKDEGKARQNQHFDDIMDSDEEDSDGGHTFATGATGLTKFSRLDKSTNGRSQRSKITKRSDFGSISSKKSAFRQQATVRLPDETNGEIVDMLGSKIAKKVQFANEEMDDNTSDDGMAIFDDNGKLVVEDDLETNEQESEGNDASQNSFKKPRLEKKDKTERRKRDSKKKSKELGASYKSKKAGGDVKRKGQKFEPYAYLPLDGRAYTKKNRSGAVEQMSSVVRGGGKRKR